MSHEELVAFRTDLEEKSNETLTNDLERVDSPEKQFFNDDFSELDSKFHDVLKHSENLVDIQETLILKKLSQLNGMQEQDKGNKVIYEPLILILKLLLQIFLLFCD